MLRLVNLSSKRDRGAINPDADFTKVVLQKTYVIEELLGQGTNAKVHKARTKKKGKVVAVKIMKTKKEIEEEMGQAGAIDDEKMFRHEIDIMVKIKEKLPNHPNIMKLIKVRLFTLHIIYRFACQMIHQLRQHGHVLSSNTCREANCSIKLWRRVILLKLMPLESLKS